ncbi:MAG: 3'-5' exonuclease [Proteobacteria bacterium]|nr:3'-5' exonuclease [Pseudomonadota bacterium]
MDFGVIIDVETTGLSPTEDKVIEIGVLEFGVGEGTRPHLLRTYGALQDPGVPISPEITKITGLTDAMVAGQQIDWAFVRRMMEKASIVIAHNADFDRGFLERVDALSGLSAHWACSMRHIDWKKHNYNTMALNYLAADHGFVNPFAHRAVFDCATTFRLIGDHLEEMITRSYEREYLIRAVGSPFESKDILRQRGYRWDPDNRVWSKVLGETALIAERQFLQEEVYKGRGSAQETEISQP